MRFALTPTICSEFLVHTNEDFLDNSLLTERILALAKQVLAEAEREHLDLKENGFCELLSEIASFTYYRRKLQCHRLSPVPWMLNPRAWSTRRRRNFYRTRIEDLQARLRKRSGVINSSYLRIIEYAP